MKEPKTPIAADILCRLSPKAIEVLADFETNIDSERRDDIPSLPGETDFDRLWLQLLAFRIFENRFNDLWTVVALDPRFPNFRKASRNNMLALTPPDVFPGEAVIEIVTQFGPRGYDARWIIEALAGYARPEWYTESYRIEEAA
jgi:hypothetical protein